MFLRNRIFPGGQTIFPGGCRPQAPLLPIRYLTDKDVQWNWAQEQDEAFERIKEAVTSAPCSPAILQYHSSKSTEDSGDASSQGIGFVRSSHIVRKSSANKRRAALLADQEELLVQVFGLECNHQYARW